MMFLPALTMTGNLGSVVTNLSKLGYTVRGIYGEGSEAGGYLYQISNNQTMGITEQQTISGLSEIVDRIADLEAQARDKVAQGGVAVSDTLCRALGTLMYARRITSGEFIDLYSKVRLGVCLGMIDDVDTDTLDRLLCQIMPGNLSLLYGRDLSEAERDTVRAEYIQKILKK